MSATALLVAHGSRDPRFAATARQVRDAVERDDPAIRVEVAYLDLDEPSVPDALARLDGDVAVVPLLLGDAFHNRVDLPALLAESARPGLRTAHAPVLADPRLTDALADRALDAGLETGDGVLMCAVGSSDAAADSATVRRGADLADTLARRGLDVAVDVAFATRSDSVLAADGRLRAAGATRVLVAPWFLSAGTLTDRVERLLDGTGRPWRMAGPLGAHPAVVDVVRARIAAATAGVMSDSGSTHR
ncbi:sirohydrochlorin chelatase [uncultured Williamsia sp.]|uniref:sirohydrochlorin chelatase n=1 Tax=uncultured Williamsia sp. TaxID=259311 RepID=UPI00262D174C|nr:sirohydrochlorin chelatase [uncultured Williamsia sp.]